MTTVRAKENEPADILLRRWKRSVEKGGKLVILRAKEFHEKTTTKRKRKKSAAVKRHMKMKRSQTLPTKLY
jgi:small subunit ribosomal protein S21